MDTVSSAQFAGLTSASTEVRKIMLYTCPEEEVFFSTRKRMPVAFPQSSCDWGMMVPKQRLDGALS